MDLLDIDPDLIYVHKHRPRKIVLRLAAIAGGIIGGALYFGAQYGFRWLSGTLSGSLHGDRLEGSASICQSSSSGASFDPSQEDTLCGLGDNPWRPEEVGGSGEQEP